MSGRFEVVTTYCDKEVLEGDSVNLAKLDPILYSMSDRTYVRVSVHIANAFEVGKKVGPTAA
jgi:hypothetical protein